jgi:membrane protease YdiL (CAAX protease family)
MGAIIGEAMRTALLLSGTGAAVGLRVAAGGDAGVAASIPAALVFALAALAVALAGGWRPRRVRATSLAIGVAAGVLLVLMWLVARPTHSAFQAADVGALALWSPAVAVVVVAEEALLRGVLFDAVRESSGAAAALLLTSVVFALVHLPLYGVQALPIDLGVGVFLGGLRLLTGTVAAPAAAHLIADLAGGWLS